MIKFFIPLLLISSMPVYADLSGGGISDYYGNGLTSNAAPLRNPLDVEIVFSNTIIDPRGRIWTLGSGTDSVTTFQGTSPWVSNITQFGGTNLSTGTGASGLGIPRFTISNDSNILATQSGAWTMAQGTPGTASGGWFFKLTDGTNTTAVKAASTAPVATDPAEVVALSPNGNQATAGNQTNGTQKTQVIDGSGNIITIKASSTAPVITDTAAVFSERPDNIGTVTQTSVSCGTSSTTLLAASTATMFFSVRNPTTATSTVWIRFDGSAATAAVPSVDLAPGSEADFFAFGTSFLPSSQFNCISGGAAASSVAVYYK